MRAGAWGGGGRPGRRGEGDIVGGEAGVRQEGCKTLLAGVGKAPRALESPVENTAAPLALASRRVVTGQWGAAPPLVDRHWPESRESWGLAFPVIHGQTLGHIWNIKEWEGAGVM